MLTPEAAVSPRVCVCVCCPPPQHVYTHTYPCSCMRHTLMMVVPFSSSRRVSVLLLGDFLLLAETDTTLRRRTREPGLPARLLLHSCCLLCTCIFDVVLLVWCVDSVWIVSGR